MINDDCSVVVFKCPSGQTRQILVDFYRYVEYFVGVKGVHLHIRDRVDDEVIFSFRILVDPGEKKRIEEVVALKLQNLLPEGKFAINPQPEHPFYKYVTWPGRDIIRKDGADELTMFYSYLNQLSRLVVEMAEKECFESLERVEMAHVACWMLGCSARARANHEGNASGILRSYRRQVSSLPHASLQRLNKLNSTNSKKLFT